MLCGNCNRYFLCTYNIWCYVQLSNLFISGNLLFSWWIILSNAVDTVTAL